MKRLILFGVLGILLCRVVVLAASKQERGPLVDPVVEKWVSRFWHYEDRVAGTGAVLPRAQRRLFTREQYQHYRERMAEERDLRKAHKRALIEEIGGLTDEEFAAFREMAYRLKQPDSEPFTPEEVQRYENYQTYASREQAETVRCQHLGTTFVLSDKQRKHKLLAEIAAAFENQDPCPDARRMMFPSNDYVVTQWRCRPDEIEAHDDGSYTITIVVGCRIECRREWDGSWTNLAVIERWRWDGKTLTCLECKYHPKTSGLIFS